MLYALLLFGIFLTRGQSTILEVTTYSDIVTDSDNTVNATDVVIFKKPRTLVTCLIKLNYLSYPYGHKWININT